MRVFLHHSWGGRRTCWRSIHSMDVFYDTPAAFPCVNMIEISCRSNGLYIKNESLCGKKVSFSWFLITFGNFSRFL